MTEEFLSVGLIEPNHWNPNLMSPEARAALKADMKENGPEGINPIEVSPYNVFYEGQPAKDGFVIVDGQNRWEIAVELGWEAIRAEKKHLTEDQAKAICYRRNKERGSIDPFKEALLFKTDVDQKLSQKEIAEKYGIDKSTVSHRLSLLRIEKPLIEKINELPRGTFSTSHLEVIATLQPPDQKKIVDSEIDDVSHGRAVTSVDVLSTQAKNIRDQREMEAKLHKAMQTAKFPKCPKCSEPPGKIHHKELPWVCCSKNPYNSEHMWNLETGKPLYEPVKVSEDLSAEEKKPKISRVIRSNYTVKQLAETFLERLKEVVPNITSADRFRICGKIGNEYFECDFSKGENRMSISVSQGTSRINFSAEAKNYRSGEKTKVEMGVWTPTQADIEKHTLFIENAFQGKLEVPSKHKKAKEGKA